MLVGRQRGPMQKSRSKTLIIAVGASATVALLVFFALIRRPAQSITYRKQLLGTIIEITVMRERSPASDSAAEAAFNEIKRLEAVFSSYIPDSDISRISSNSGKGPVKVSPEVIEVIEKALYVARISGGAFDPTVGALAKLWGFSGESGRVPEAKDVDALKRLVDFRQVVVAKGASTVALKNKGMTLNLGGVAKGYITARAAEVLGNKGIERALIKAGGDMVVFSGKADKPFVVGIQDPRAGNRLMGEAYVSNGAVSTSGDYERFFIKDKKRYHHILNPATGFPAEGVRSATVISKDPTLADALSTAVFVMGAEKGMALIEVLDDVEGVIVDAQGSVHTSKGFKGRVYKDGK